MSEDNFHPLANLFPLLTGADFDALVADVRADGIREPIWRHPDGRIIDGRNRWRAAREAGVECPSSTYTGSDDGLLAFIISMNLHRRHLDASQRAMIAAELATLSKGRPSKTASKDAVSDARAAKLLNVSEASVERAKLVRREGVPELVEAVEQGKLPVSRAAVITRAEPARQRRIVAGEEPVVKLVPKPKKRVRIVYYEPAQTTVRVSARLTEPDSQPRDLSKLAVVRPAVPTALTEIRAGFWATDRLSPEAAAVALPPEWRADFVARAQKQQAWLTEFLGRATVH